MEWLLARKVDELASASFHLTGEAPRETAARELAYVPGALYPQMGYGRVPATGVGPTVADSPYPVSHLVRRDPGSHRPPRAMVVLDSFRRSTYASRTSTMRDEFRTRRLVLAAYDALTRAAETGVPYRSPLHPPPGDGRRYPARAT